MIEETNSNSAITLFVFEGAAVRTLLVDSEPWFVGRDVAVVLGYTNPSKALSDHCKCLKRLDTNETLVFNEINGLRGDTLIIPERDVYRLIMRSKLPAAERFEEFVVGEVLPTIRKTGQYGNAPVLQALAAISQRLDATIIRVDNLQLAADPRVAVLAYVSIRQLLDEAKALAKCRRSLQGRLFSELRNLALIEGVAMLRSPHGGQVWLFPRAFADQFMRERGKAMVNEHNAKLRGQGILTFPCLRQQLTSKTPPETPTQTGGEGE